LPHNYIHLTHIQDSIRLTVSDNGRGFDAATVTTGMGLRNLQRRAEKHNGGATIASSPHGTTFTLVLPLHA
jgi:signal transduction histidine kinase